MSENEINNSLLDELNDLNYMLDSAIHKAKHLEKNIVKGSSAHLDYEEPVQEIEPQNIVVKPKGWDSSKSASALEDSLNAFDDKMDIGKDTTKARTVSKKVTKKLDDNWDDDPF